MAVSQLGYLVFEVSDTESWEAFASHVLGVQVVNRREDGGFGMRIDANAQRFFVEPGPADDLAVLGLEVSDGEELRAVSASVSAAGVEVTPGSAALAERRGVVELMTFKEPGGVTVELYHGARVLSGEPVVSKTVASHFIAGELCCGHCVLRATDMDATEAFFFDVLGFKLSDRIICDMGGYQVNITFTHINPRHHSVAFGAGLPKHIHHFLLQVATLDDVGMAFDRAVDSGVRITQTIGRHPNDKMVSFYAQTPSGFDFEYGWGALEIDDDVWTPKVHNRVSEWGHRRPPYRRPKK